MPSPELAAWRALTLHERERLLAVAAASIDHGLEHGRPLPLDAAEDLATLREPGASFVTLRREGELRGCVGALEAFRPLVEDVAQSAFAAAFRDPRFPPLRRDERAKIDIHVTILGPASPIRARDERELLAQLRPGIDGLVLREGEVRATLLPAVWERMPDPEHFLAALRRKAGLPDGHWSSEVEVLRYEVVELP